MSDPRLIDPYLSLPVDSLSALLLQNPMDLLLPRPEIVGILIFIGILRLVSGVILLTKMRGRRAIVHLMMAHRNW